MRWIPMAGLLAITAALSWSATLPPPTSVVTCTDKFVLQDPSSCVNGGASASLTLLPFVNETVEAFAPATDPILGIFNANSHADIKYFFEVDGGHLNDLVPVNITANLSVAATSLDHAIAFASIFVITSQGTTQVCVASPAFGGCPAGAFSGTFTVMVGSGQGNTLVLDVSAGAGDSPFAERASASADPLIFIDPSFAGASQYSIQLSPGVGNGIASAAPEPSAFIPLAALLPVLGYYRSRRRRSQARP